MPRPGDRLPASDIDAIRRPRWHGWWQHAKCLHGDPDLWFPEKGHADQSFWARAICSTCPVRGECLDQALAERHTHGIWGGTTPGQREGHYDVARSPIRSLLDQEGAA